MPLKADSDKNKSPKSEAPATDDSRLSGKICFRPLHPEDTDALAFVQTLYSAAFPVNERRPFTQYKTLLADPRYRMELLLLNGQPSGFFSFWLLDSFLFLEHFAVAQSHRSKGLGRKALSTLMRRYPLPFILEVEPPETGDMACRRIRFYQAAGFMLNQMEHLQPAYVEDKEPVRLRLMSWPGEIENYAEVNEALHGFVYRP